MKTLILLLLSATSLHAAELRVDELFAFERMKADSNYNEDVKKPGLFFLWISYENPAMYQELLTKYPDAKHSFIEQKDLTTYNPKGIIVRCEGIPILFQEEKVSGVLANNFSGNRRSSVISSNVVRKIPVSQNVCVPGVGNCKDQSRNRIGSLP